MPKMKSNRGACKRFSRTGTGKWKHKKTFARHILTKKSAKRKRNYRNMEQVHPSDVGFLGRLLPYR